MIDFAPTEEQTAIRDLARQIALEQFRKLARQGDEDCATSDYMFELLGQTGFLSPFPEEFGGAGVQSAVTHALIAEELAYGDGGYTLSYLGAILPGLAVTIAGTDEQQRLLLPRCCDPGSTGALGWSEPASGLDARETQTTLRASADALDVQGVKRSVVHGAVDGLRIVTAREAAVQGLAGLRLVALPDHAAGISATPEAEPLGLRAAPRSRLHLEDVAVSAGDVLGGIETGSAGAQRFIGLANVLLGALAVGTASAALDYAADYAKGRVQFGKPISSFQAIAFMAAEMAMESDAARLLLWRAASAWDAGEDALRRCERARTQAVKVAQRVTTDAVQILGGAGFLQDHPVELWMRNAEALAALG
ncbi:MAG TPA: acyl-CoA dehydrogenase family protein [Ktedonobacterales bacterium]|nr:acyl-CoA dehydrogenase family protein [Ktedonobacterales bacterium]